MSKSIFSFVLLFVLVNLVTHAQQNLSTKSKKAIEYYTQADNYRVRGHVDMAIDLLNKALEKDNEFVEAYELLAKTYDVSGNFTLAEQNFLKALELSGNAPPVRFYFYLGRLYLTENDYAKSVEYLKKFLIKASPNNRSAGEAVKMLESAEFALKSISESVPISIEELSDTVNQFPMQYFPVLTADQKQLVFTRRLGSGPSDDEDLVTSFIGANGEWTTPISLSENINSQLNEGTCTISADGRTLIFTSCHGREGYGSCDLFISKRKGDVWSIPINMGPEINSTAWDSQPSLSADGRTLYFVSTRGGGKGQQDIWVSSLRDDNVWSKPKNLGLPINTPENEISPFIHSNGKTLFFASNGHLGMGGFDIFSSELENGGYSAPKNFGHPVNDGSDQVSIFITADGQRAYYSNECNESPRTCSKIFTFEIPAVKQVRHRSNYITGLVIDSLSGKPTLAQIDLYDTEKNERLLSVTSDSVTGEYLMVLTEGTNYALYVNSVGYLFKNENFEYINEKGAKPIHKNILLSPIQKDSKTELRNIFFDFDSDQLTEQSKIELQVVINFLKANPNTRIRIEGHTDNVGNEDYNLKLSRRRAKTVYDYLLEHDIPQNRLESEGYGSRFPKYGDREKITQEKNRRIEFVIL